ncbi:hypothetical protein K439DRAFT_1623043 [Ramaria rubella]|nr:hypothetical protein K439DRAFT_1623043 [Ramaria rubella]
MASLLSLVVRPDRLTRHFVASPSSLSNVAFTEDLVVGSAARAVLKVIQFHGSGSSTQPGQTDANTICELVEGKHKQVSLTFPLPEASWLEYQLSGVNVEMKASLKKRKIDDISAGRGTTLLRNDSINIIPARDLGETDSHHWSMLDSHQEKNPQGVTFFDIVMGSRAQVQRDSHIMIKYNGTLLDSMVWGRPKDTVGINFMINAQYTLGVGDSSIVKDNRFAISSATVFILIHCRMGMRYAWNVGGREAYNYGSTQVWLWVSSDPSVPANSRGSGTWITPKVPTNSTLVIGEQSH